MHISIRYTIVVVVAFVAALFLSFLHAFVTLAADRSIIVGVLTSIIVGLLIGLSVVLASSKLEVNGFATVLIAGLAALLGWYWYGQTLVDSLRYIVAGAEWSFAEMEERFPHRLFHSRAGYFMRSLGEVSSSQNPPTGMVLAAVGSVGSAVLFTLFSSRASLGSSRLGNEREEALPVCQVCGSNYVTEQLFAMPASRFASLDISMRDAFGSVSSAEEFLQNVRRRSATPDEREVRGSVIYCDRCLNGELLVRTYSEQTRDGRSLVRDESIDLDPGIVRHMADKPFMVAPVTRADVPRVNYPKIKSTD